MVSGTSIIAFICIYILLEIIKWQGKREYKATYKGKKRCAIDIEINKAQAEKDLIEFTDRAHGMISALIARIDVLQEKISHTNSLIVGGRNDVEQI